MTGRIAPAALALEHVSVRAGGRALVDAVSLAAAPGEMVGLIGPNGAGKSTLLRSIYRAQRPDAGAVRLDGTDLWAQSVRWAAQRVAAVLQDMPAEFPLTVTDVVAMGRAPHKSALAADTEEDVALIDAAIALMDLLPLRARPFAQLSGGERQRALLARALVQQPRLLVLDEPTNHLDLRHQVGFLDLVRRTGATVVAALHDLTLAAMVCDRLVLLDGGRAVAEGPPAEVLTAERIGAVYGLPVTVTRHPSRGTPLVLPR